MEDGHPLGVLCPNKMEQLLEQNRITLPSIDENDILDRSKVDGISKVLVVAQTSWFIGQCLSRRFLGLDITQIELITLAYAALNWSMYFLWWNKPMDVRYTVPVYLLPRPQTIIFPVSVTHPEAHDAPPRVLLEAIENFSSFGTGTDINDLTYPSGENDLNCELLPLSFPQLGQI